MLATLSPLSFRCETQKKAELHEYNDCRVQKQQCWHWLAVESIISLYLWLLQSMVGWSVVQVQYDWFYRTIGSFHHNEAKHSRPGNPRCNYLNDASVLIPNSMIAANCNNSFVVFKISLLLVHIKYLVIVSFFL